MKKLLSVAIALVICALTFITAFADAAPFQTYTALVNPGGATIYVKDEKSGEEKPVKVPEFSKITVLSYSNYEDENGKKATYFVNYGKYFGNIYNDDFYVSDFTAIGELFAPVNYPDSYKVEEFFATVTEEGSLNERTGPSTVYEKKGELSNGTIIKCHYKYNGWAYVSGVYEVDSNGKAGFQFEESWVSLTGLKIIDKSQIPKYPYGIEDETVLEETTQAPVTKTTSANETTSIPATSEVQNEIEDFEEEDDLETDEYYDSSSVICIIIAVVIAMGSGAALMIFEKKRKLKKSGLADTEQTENTEVPGNNDET